MAQRSRFLSADGIAHTRLQEDRAENHYNNKIGKWYTKESADVCLNCSKKNCKGGYKCYENREKEAKK